MSKAPKIITFADLPGVQLRMVAHYVVVHGKLTEKQFREIENLVGESLGRFKDWAERFNFDLTPGMSVGPLLAYLNTLPNVVFEYHPTYTRPPKDKPE